MDKFIEETLTDLVKKGSDKKDIEAFKNNILYSMKYADSRPKEDIIKILENEIVEKSHEFLNSHNEINENLLTALSTCIYIPDYETGDYKIKFISGKNNSGIDVNNETLYDVASVTKMYSLLLIFKLAENQIINLNDKICDLDDRFKNLEDFTVNDLIKMCGIIYTNGNVKDGKSKEDALEILKTAYLKSNDRTQNTYTDVGMIILSKVIEKKVSEYLNEDMTYDQIMDKYLLKPFGLNNTVFNPTTNNVAGNGHTDSIVHDPKSRILGGAVGSAGIFTNADDLAKLAKEMYKVNYYNKDIIGIVSKKNLKSMGTIIFPDSAQSNKGLAGIYQKNQDRENKWLQPLAYSDYSFTAQGWTGAVASFDPNNFLHNSFLVDSIKEGNNGRPNGYMKAFEVYQRFIVGMTINLYVIKKYYDRFYEKNDYEKTL